MCSISHYHWTSGIILVPGSTVEQCFFPAVDLPGFSFCSVMLLRHGINLYRPPKDVAHSICLINIVYYLYIVDITFFQCQNGGCLIELAQQLAVIMVGKQFLNNTQEILVP